MTNIIDIEDFVNFYKVNYNIGADRRYSNLDLWKLKAFTYCAVHMFGFSVKRTAKAIHKHHSTLLYHLKKIHDYEIKRAELMNIQYYSWCKAAEPPICSMAWFRKYFPFPFRICKIEEHWLEIRVHPEYYEECKEIWRNYVPVKYGVTITKDEDIVAGKIFYIRGNTYE